MADNKKYFLYGYEIVRKYHYVDAFQHYIYRVNLDGMIKECKSLKDAKDAIREHLGLKRNED